MSLETLPWRDVRFPASHLRAPLDPISQGQHSSMVVLVAFVFVVVVEVIAKAWLLQWWSLSLLPLLLLLLLLLLLTQICVHRLLLYRQRVFQPLQCLACPTKCAPKTTACAARQQSHDAAVVSNCHNFVHDAHSSPWHSLDPHCETQQSSTLTRCLKKCKIMTLPTRLKRRVRI